MKRALQTPPELLPLYDLRNPRAVQADSLATGCDS